MDGKNTQISGVENLQQATFQCVFPVCGGICCRQGEPPIEPDEEARIRENLPRLLGHLRPAVQQHLADNGPLMNSRDDDLPMLAVVDEWCVFFNEGCVLHKVGAAEGDKSRYKPWRCSVFPLRRSDDAASWYVRQWELKGEEWDLFCLNPAESPLVAADTLHDELQLMEQVERKYYGGEIGFVSLSDLERSSPVLVTGGSDVSDRARTKPK